MQTPDKNTIIFTLIYKDEVYQVQTYRNQYFSLMSLISDCLTMSGFGLCCGMGSCGTCMVDIEGSTTLSCSIPVNDALANTRIKIIPSVF